MKVVLFPKKNLSLFWALVDVFLENIILSLFNIRRGNIFSNSILLFHNIFHCNRKAKQEIFQLICFFFEGQI